MSLPDGHVTSRNPAPCPLLPSTRTTSKSPKSTHLQPPPGPQATTAVVTTAASQQTLTLAVVIRVRVLTWITWGWGDTVITRVLTRGRRSESEETRPRWQRLQGEAARNQRMPAPLETRKGREQSLPGASRRIVAEPAPRFQDSRPPEPLANESAPL